MRRPAAHVGRHGGGTRFLTGLSAVLFLWAAIALPGCARTTPAGSDDPAGSGSGSFVSSDPSDSGPASPTPDSAAGIRFRILALNGRLMLLAAPDSFDYGSLSGSAAPFAYLLSEDGSQWLATDYSAAKIGTLTDVPPDGTEEQSADVYRLSFGSWSCHALLYNRDFPESVEEHWIRLLAEGSANDILPVSKDYSIAHFWNDLYAIGRDDTIRRISSRRIGAYDFDTIGKGGKIDGLSWEWTFLPICDPADNVIYYLTSREKTSYAVWKIDLDAGTEGKFCDDIVTGFGGCTGRWLAVALNSLHSDRFGKLLLRTDPSSFEYTSVQTVEQAAAGFWFSMGGWMCRANGGELVMDNGTRSVTFAADSSAAPLLLDRDRLWILDSFATPGRLWVIGPESGTCYSAAVGATDTIAGWSRLLQDIGAGLRPVAEADTGGADVRISPSAQEP